MKKCLNIKLNHYIYIYVCKFCSSIVFMNVMKRNQQSKKKKSDLGCFS